MKLLSRLSALAALLALLAQPAAALVEQSFLQWQETGDTVPNASPVRVYARALKTGCTGVCETDTLLFCQDMTKTLFYRAQGQSTYTSMPMTFNNGDCYTPLDEYFADIPTAALSGDSVFFYCEFADGDGAAAFTARPGSPEATFTATTPAFYLVENATSENFTLHVVGDFHCVTNNGQGPGISGSFNGWVYQAMTQVSPRVYAYDIVWPAGSALTIEFKFRNGTDWESLPGGPFANREFTVPSGATTGEYSGYWNDEAECPCVEAPLGANAMVIFAVDMQHQDPASYAGGVGIRGTRAPLNWDTTIALSDVGHPGLFSGMVIFPAGTLNTLEYKFLKSTDGTAWTYEDGSNRRLCMVAGFTALPNAFFSNYVPPAGTTVPITAHFSQDMNCIGTVTSVSLQGSVAPLDWTAGTTPMTDADLDGVWEADVTFPVGSAFEVEYKTAFTTDGSTWNWEDNILNRPFTLDDATPNMTLPPTSWDDWFCPPNLEIVYVGGQVTLSWTAVPLATGYSVYSQIDGYPAPTSLSTFVTTTTDTTVTLPATGRAFYVVIAEK